MKDVLSIGLTVGASLSGIIQFFAITYPGASITWWGNTYYLTGCDALGCPLKELPAQGYFGPAVSHTFIVVQSHAHISRANSKAIISTKE